MQHWTGIPFVPQVASTRPPGSSSTGTRPVSVNDGRAGADDTSCRYEPMRQRRSPSSSRARNGTGAGDVTSFVTRPVVHSRLSGSDDSTEWRAHGYSWFTNLMHWP